MERDRKARQQTHRQGETETGETRDDAPGQTNTKTTTHKHVEEERANRNHPSGQRSNKGQTDVEQSEGG